MTLEVIKSRIEKLLERWGYVPQSKLEEVRRNAEFQASLLRRKNEDLQRIVDNNIAEIARSVGQYVNTDVSPIEHGGYRVTIDIDYRQLQTMFQELDRQGSHYYLEHVVMGLGRKIETDLTALLRLRPSDNRQFG